MKFFLGFIEDFYFLIWELRGGFSGEEGRREFVVGWGWLVIFFLAFRFLVIFCLGFLGLR